MCSNSRSLFLNLLRACRICVTRPAFSPFCHNVASNPFTRSTMASRCVTSAVDRRGGWNISRLCSSDLRLFVVSMTCIKTSAIQNFDWPWCLRGGWEGVGREGVYLCLDSYRSRAILPSYVLPISLLVFACLFFFSIKFCVLFLSPGCSYRSMN